MHLGDVRTDLGLPSDRGDHPGCVTEFRVDLVELRVTLLGPTLFTGLLDYGVCGTREFQLLLA